MLSVREALGSILRTKSTLKYSAFDNLLRPLNPVSYQDWCSEGYVGAASGVSNGPLTSVQPLDSLALAFPNSRDLSLMLHRRQIACSSGDSDNFRSQRLLASEYHQTE